MCDSGRLAVETGCGSGAGTIGGLIADGAITEGAFLLFEGEEEMVEVVAVGRFSLFDSKGRCHRYDAVVDAVIA